MKQHYYYAMELVNHYGKADLFITFTANPYWDEIMEHIVDGRNYLSRPDICSRVYEMKFNNFLKDVIVDSKLGKLIFYYKY